MEERQLAKYPKELECFEGEINERSFSSISTYIDYKVGYWRKANAIHKWFVDNCAEGVDNCKDVYVSREKAERLLELCDLVLENPKEANEELPVEKGFFFGSQEYDEWYFKDIKYTKDLLQKVLAFLDKDEEGIYEILYCASW